MKPALLALCALLALPTAVSAATPLGGRYLIHDGSGVVELKPCGTAICGRLVEIRKAAPDQAMTDVKNSDKALRSRPLMGIPILDRLTNRGSDWRGTLYDPRSGTTYRAIVRRNPDGSLAVQGCITFLCKTKTWKAVG